MAISLIDMKLPKRTKEELKNECMPMAAEEQDRWPYGLEIRLEKDQLDKMPEVKNYKVGDKVIVYAEASITGTRISERQKGKDNHTMELQLEKIAVTPAKKKKMEAMTPREYRNARSK